jgi:hypothetical protein
MLSSVLRPPPSKLLEPGRSLQIFHRQEGVDASRSGPISEPGQAVRR